jgi:hypothetical protein
MSPTEPHAGTALAPDPGASDPWHLSAPESLVLRDGPRAKPADVVRVAVLELVARRVLRLVEVETRGLLGRPGTEVVVGAGSQPAPADGPLAAIADIALESKARTYPDGTVGIAVHSLAMACAARYGRPPRLFIDRSVLPALEARGLFTTTRRKVLGLFPSTSWVRTADGDRARDRLLELTTTAERDVAEWSERDPRRLARFLAAAGSAALLVPAAYPAFEAFVRRLAGPPDDGGVAGALVATWAVGSDDATPVDGFGDLGGLDFSALSFDVSGLTAIDGAFAGFDAGMAGGASGGDGGGSSSN